MSLTRATLRGGPTGLRGPGPYTGAELVPLQGQKFALSSDDPWLRDASGHARAYLDGSREAWLDHPDHMDFLDPESPVHTLKRIQRDLSLAGWGAQELRPVRRVLDVGCGIGRFATWFLDRGVEVHAVDPDLDSLRRLVWHAARSPGRLDVYRASAEHLPQVTVDHVVLAEVLNYVPDAVGALRAAAARLAPGGTVWLSLEAPFGWAVAPDAPADTWRSALEGSPVDVPGRWVQTYDAAGVRALVASAGLVLDRLVPSHWTFDGPLENTLPADADFEMVSRIEALAERHPVFGPLHRLWLVTAHRGA